MQDDRKTQAKRWVNGYSGAGAVIVMAAVIPGSTSAALCVMEGHMCYKIGKIYLGENYTITEATKTARAIGLAAITGKLVALELLNCVPGIGHAAKVLAAGAVVKALGESIIHYYEKRTGSLEIIEAKVVSESEGPRTARPPFPPPLPLAARGVQERLEHLVDLHRRSLITAVEYETKRQQILNEL